MENFNVKSKTEVNLRTGETKQIVQALVVNRGIPTIFTIAQYSERNGKVSVMKSNPDML